MEALFPRKRWARDLRGDGPGRHLHLHRARRSRLGPADGQHPSLCWLPWGAAGRSPGRAGCDRL